mmetsp:Transcript_108325/g.212269  ORF Transcript_108325/g.212269 Transcript_108325/m.212269 type:complete len:268 (+) Transcript_108325:97-900(+)
MVKTQLILGAAAACSMLHGATACTKWEHCIEWTKKPVPYCHTFDELPAVSPGCVQQWEVCMTLKSGAEVAGCPVSGEVKTCQKNNCPPQPEFKYRTMTTPDLPHTQCQTIMPRQKAVFMFHLPGGCQDKVGYTHKIVKVDKLDCTLGYACSPKPSALDGCPSLPDDPCVWEVDAPPEDSCCNEAPLFDVLNPDGTVAIPGVLKTFSLVDLKYLFAQRGAKMPGLTAVDASFVVAAAAMGAFAVRCRRRAAAASGEAEHEPLGVGEEQ